MISPDPTISVIIPSFNSGRTIRICLEAVVTQATRRPFEVIVVDSSTDGTASLIAAEFPLVKLVTRPERTSAADARNIAAATASGDLLLFTDADCVPLPTWLDALVAEIEEHGHAAVVGGVEPANLTPLIGHALFLLEFRPFHYQNRRRQVPTFVTCNLAMRRRTFETLGPFRTGRSLAEDSLLAERLRAVALSMQFAPHARVRHVNRPGLRANWRHAQRLGSATAEAFSMAPSINHAQWRRRPTLLAALAPLLMPLWIISELGRSSPRSLLTTVPFAPLVSLLYLAWGIGFRKACSTPAVRERLDRSVG